MHDIERARQREKQWNRMNSVHRGILSGETVPTSPWLFSSLLGLCGFSFFFFLVSQTPWKRKPSERMMRREEHRGFKHTHGHSPICLAHNLLCWQTKQSKGTLAVFIEAWLKASYILKPDGAEKRRCWRYYFAHCFHTVLQLLPLYPLAICSEHCVWAYTCTLNMKCIVSEPLTAPNRTAHNKKKGNSRALRSCQGGLKNNVS